MRDTNQLPSLELVDLVAVTGGCKKKQAPAAPPQAPACNCDGGSVEVSVSTGGQSQAPQLI